jgi:alpha-galactosidase
MPQWRLDTQLQTLILGNSTTELPAVLYWGSALPAQERLCEITQASVNTGTLDTTAKMSICPQHSDSFPGQVGMLLRDAQGHTLWTKFALESEAQNSENLSLIFSDQGLGLQYQLLIGIDNTNNLFTFSAKVTSEQAIYMDWLAAPVLPAPQNSQHSLEFSGPWCGEFKINQVPWSPGARTRENRLGRTSYEHFPGLIIPALLLTITLAKLMRFTTVGQVGTRC